MSAVAPFSSDHETPNPGSGHMELANSSLRSDHEVTNPWSGHM